MKLLPESNYTAEGAIRKLAGDNNRGLLKVSLYERLPFRLHDKHFLVHKGVTEESLIYVCVNC